MMGGIFVDKKNKVSVPHSIVYTNIGYQMYREPKSLSTSSDVFYNVESRIPITNVAIPTLDAIIEAKEWVDDENKK